MGINQVYSSKDVMDTIVNPFTPKLVGLAHQSLGRVVAGVASSATMPIHNMSKYVDIEVENGYLSEIAKKVCIKSVTIGGT